MAAIPSLLACSGLHHHLVRQGQRSRAGLLIECGDAREVHHFALLLGYGAGTINPYVAFETLDDMIRQGLLKGLTHEEAVYRYRKAIKKGVVKVMSKMGISTIQSYRGAADLRGHRPERGIRRPYFDKTASRVGGVGLEEIARETLEHHSRAHAIRDAGRLCSRKEAITSGGGTASITSSTPKPSSGCSTSTQAGRYDIFKKYTRMVDEQNERLCTLRGLFEFRRDHCKPIPIDEVEPVESIVKRFASGAMSYGSISAEAHETLAIAMNRIGGRSNTGEGGRRPRAVQALARRRQQQTRSSRWPPAGSA